MSTAGLKVGDVVGSELGWRGVVTDLTLDGSRVAVDYEWTGQIKWVSVDSLTVDIYHGSSMNRRVSAVTKPAHYDLPGGIQVIDLIRDESFLRGNLIKYVFRAPHKGNELEDLKKAAEYLKWEIERVENGN